MNKINDEAIEDIFYTLQYFLNLYNDLKKGNKYSTPEILKSVQNSIKELCTLIMQKTSN